MTDLEPIAGDGITGTVVHFRPDEHLPTHAEAGGLDDNAHPPDTPDRRSIVKLTRRSHRAHRHSAV
ncbi:hypothetical protein [Nonomuraea deserti]|uniref:hypothetical protein n=1 Tax=Nonomuraea deserti TaxID=1848322 RepID=UPI0015F2BCCE|nr:hypothetical protein [Nonomuraea deserti]